MEWFITLGEKSGACKMPHEQKGHHSASSAASDKKQTVSQKQIRRSSYVEESEENGYRVVLRKNGCTDSANF